MQISQDRHCLRASLADVDVMVTREVRVERGEKIEDPAYASDASKLRVCDAPTGQMLQCQYGGVDDRKGAV